MSGINVPLLRKSLEHIDAHPEEHDQRHWAQRTPCGTKLCLAGTAVVLSGYDIRWGEDAIVSAQTTTGAYIEDLAQEQLGLNDSAANWLFHKCEDADDLWDAAAWITDGEIRRLP